MYCTLEELKQLKTQNKRLIAFDVGDRRVGVGSCDATWFIASPLCMLDRKTNWQDELKKKLSQYNVAAFVVGLPLLMNGDEGPQAKKVKDFVEQYLFAYNVPVFLWDERLSTTAVTRTLVEADLSRAKQKNVVDQAAASFILQGVLDRLQRL